MSTTDPCFDKQDGMLSVDQAIEQLLSRATALTEQERVDLHAGAGRVLAEDLASPIDVPGFDNSAMDGYALHSRDIATARDAGLPVTQRITAGAVEVSRRLRVAVFSTGDELVEPGKPLAPGQIYNSNRYQLNALLAAQGCEVIDLGSIADDFGTTRETLLQAASQADLVMTTGGVSVGEEDHVKAALESVGALHLWRIRMKPGKPLAFGRIGDTPFIGLPGNPVSVFVTFLLFARPYLQAMQGRADTGPRRYPVRAGFDYRAKQRREYMRVRLHTDQDGMPVAETFPRQGSDVLSSVAWADGLAEITEESSVQAGEAVSFLPFAE